MDTHLGEQKAPLKLIMVKVRHKNPCVVTPTRVGPVIHFKLTKRAEGTVWRKLGHARIWRVGFG